MNLDFLPFALPDIGEEEIAEVVDAMRSGWITTGPKTRQFEGEFAAFVGRGEGDPVEAISVNSATAGMHLALEAIGLKAGDEVITTVYTFTATAEVIRYFGAHPVFVDIDPDTLNIDPSKIEAAITPRTKAIMPVHFAGLACDMDAILEIAGRHGLRVIEDAAHSLPTTYKGQLIGSLASDIAVFSFYATKTVATGEGGMIVTRDKALAKRMRIMRLHGIDRDAFDRYTSKKPAWYYEVVAPGFKYNLTDIASAIGIHQLRKAHKLRDRREVMARRYDEGLAGLPVVLPPRAADDDVHSYHLYVLRLNAGAGITRDKVIEQMAARGVGTSVHFIPLCFQPYWRDQYRLSAEQYPSACGVFENVFSLPIYTKMTEADQQRVMTALREVLS